MLRVLTVLTGMFLVMSSPVAKAGDWPAWRGPHYNGVCDETGLPTTWSPTSNVKWKVALPGQAGSTPVVSGKHIFLTSVNGEKTVLICMDTTGKELWRKMIAEGNQMARKDEGNSASSSPVTDGKHVWVTVGTGDIACFDFAGNKVWGYDLEEKYGPIDIQFGFSTTPVLEGDRLYYQLLHGNMSTADLGFSKIICLDKNTGKEIYAVERKSEATHENKHSYASAMLADDHGKKILLVHGGDYITAHDLADGKELWRCGDMNPADKYDKFLRFVASPVANEGYVIAPTAKHGPAIGIKLGGHGNITHKEGYELWRLKKTPDVPSPVIKDGIAYLCMQDGSFYCVKVDSGEECYPPKRLFNDRYRASPVYADGKIYCVSRKGVISVVKAGPEYELLSENKMDEEISASLAISDGVIYIRTFENLYAIGK